MLHGYQVTELTANKLKRVQRNSTFGTITAEDVAYFKSILPLESVLEKESCPEEIYLKYTTDWYNVYRANPAVILFPETTLQVSKILKYCNDRHLAIVPQSGNTSAAGGSVPVFDEIIISTHKLNKIRSFDPLRGDLICEAGCVLQDLDNYLVERGYQIPLDLPARHICRIGGNIATNAGGIRQMRFGNLHSSVMGLEVVLPDGTILDNLTTLKKDNTGYHLKNLFIGSEGTLGFVTAVSITTPRLRDGVNVFLLGFSNFQQVVETYSLAKKELPETLSAFEVFDNDSVRCVREQDYQEPAGSPFPIQDTHHVYVVLETAGTVPKFENEKADRFLSLLRERGFIQDGAIARTAAERARFWSWRTKLPRAIVQNGPSSIHFDISLPLPRLYQLVEDTRSWAIAEGLIPNDIVAVYGYGHVGDGNLHLTIPALRDDQELTEKVDRFVYEWTAKYQGSISAEHGVGLMKSPYLAYTKSCTMINTMRKIKDLFDPHQIMNPYKVFPTESQEEEGELIRKKFMVGC
ncbi:uncharacterized protein BX663DRAFT_488899 [Cokeromyces recurvatus]|uniref:uncharacterized protein n=1 Tax=Cokeromyces recurvatus TaxID=90255 RepID=UPI00221FF75C|nr:uncharacterized protein BX663DRAFT_488899 [Cokeromyces recurvatus]KAI7899913.1 hypothetical protein BX663DRAFT_488899 [Cokeromyces recurvatus]